MKFFENVLPIINSLKPKETKEDIPVSRGSQVEKSSKDVQQSKWTSKKKKSKKIKEFRIVWNRLPLISLYLVKGDKEWYSFSASNWKWS